MENSNNLKTFLAVKLRKLKPKKFLYQDDSQSANSM